MGWKFPGANNIPPLFPFILLFLENVFKHKEILLIHTLPFLLSPLMVCILGFGWFLKRAHVWPAVWFPTATYTRPGHSPVIFKAWLSSDKVSSTHSLSTSAVFLEVNQSILPSGTNGNLPERNNYCTWKIYWSILYGSPGICGSGILFEPGRSSLGLRNDKIPLNTFMLYISEYLRLRY